MLSPTGSRATQIPHRERDSSSIPRALLRDFNNYTYTLPLSARAAIMFFITAAAASTQGQWIGDEIFAAMAEYKVSPSAVRVVIVTLSSPSDKLWHRDPVKSRALHGKKQPLQQQREAPRVFCTPLGTSTGEQRKVLAIGAALMRVWGLQA